MDAHHAIDALLQRLPSSADVCLPKDAVRDALHAIVRLGSVRPDATAAVYGYTHLAEALGHERLSLMARLLEPLDIEANRPSGLADSP